MVSKKVLLIIGGTLWFIAGGVLVYRGVDAIAHSNTTSILKIVITVIAAILFYVLIFKRVAFKQISRLEQMPNSKYPFYMFLSIRSFLMMLLMMGIGIALRKSGIVSFNILMFFLPVMGSSLLISAFRFYRHAIK